MRVRVLHNPDFLKDYWSETLSDLSKMVPVAELEVDDIEFAYEYTNTIDAPWWDNERVTRLFDGDGCRSTSPSDVIHDLDSDTFYAVLLAGFKEYPKHETA